MGLKGRMHELTSIEQVDHFLAEHPVCALFKAGACHKTMQGFGYVEEALDGLEGIHLAFVKVIENRPVSNYIASLTGVVHQSPQFILMLEGKPVYDVDNWDIVPSAIERALNEHLGGLQFTESSKITETAKSVHSKSGGVEPYMVLLRELVKGNINHEDFKYQWLMMFQRDAALRSSREFNLLNSLYGDVDRAIEEEILQNTLGPQGREGDAMSRSETLVHRAEKLLNELESLS